MTTSAAASMCGAVRLEELVLVPPRLVPAVADPADHAVDDDAERIPAVAMLPRLELAPQPLADRLRRVLADRASQLRDAATADRLHPAREQELDLPGFQQSLVLGISRIAHREVSHVGHARILRSARYGLRPRGFGSAITSIPSARATRATAGRTSRSSPSGKAVAIAKQSASETAFAGGGSDGREASAPCSASRPRCGDRTCDVGEEAADGSSTRRRPAPGGRGSGRRGPRRR